MRHRLLCRVILLLVVLSQQCVAVFLEDADFVDKHRKLIGGLTSKNTFFHSSGSGTLAYAATDRNILAALSLRDGHIGKDRRRVTHLVC